MRYKLNPNKPCRECGRNLSYRNRLKGTYMCKKCARKYRAELNEKKLQNNRDKFLAENPDVLPIEGFGDKYLVSDKGDIYRATSTGVKKLKIAKDRYGYYSISLYHEGKRKTLKVHKVVAKAFIPNPYPYVKKIINHKDGVKSNNHVSNLEWCTHKQNSVHAVKTGLIAVGEANKGSKLTEEQVKEICALRGRVTQKELAERFGVSKKLITLIQHKKVWKHVGRSGLKPKRRLLLNRKKKKVNES